MVTEIDVQMIVHVSKCQFRQPLKQESCSTRYEHRENKNFYFHLEQQISTIVHPDFHFKQQISTIVHPSENMEIREM